MRYFVGLDVGQVCGASIVLQQIRTTCLVRAQEAQPHWSSKFTWRKHEWVRVYQCHAYLCDGAPADGTFGVGH